MKSYKTLMFTIFPHQSFKDIKNSVTNISKVSKTFKIKSPRETLKKHRKLRHFMILLTQNQSFFTKKYRREL